jgi:hypothetical protein
MLRIVDAFLDRMGLDREPGVYQTLRLFFVCDVLCIETGWEPSPVGGCITFASCWRLFTLYLATATSGCRPTREARFVLLFSCVLSIASSFRFVNNVFPKNGINADIDMSCQSAAKRKETVDIAETTCYP